MSEPNTTLITSHTIRINILLSFGSYMYGFEAASSILYFTVVYGASISFYGGEKVAHSVLLSSSRVARFLPVTINNAQSAWESSTEKGDKKFMFAMCGVYRAVTYLFWDVLSRLCWPFSSSTFTLFRSDRFLIPFRSEKAPVSLTECITMLWYLRYSTPFELLANE